MDGIGGIFFSTRSSHFPFLGRRVNQMPWVEHLLFSREFKFPRPFKFGKLGLLKLQSKTKWAGWDSYLGPASAGCETFF